MVDVLIRQIQQWLSPNQCMKIKNIEKRINQDAQLRHVIHKKQTLQQLLKTHFKVSKSLVQLKPRESKSDNLLTLSTVLQPQPHVKKNTPLHLLSTTKCKGESALLGTQLTHAQKNVYMNVRDPFCCVTLGAQGGGKSHTLNVMLENCLLMKQPMAGMVLHYDQCESNICESTGLAKGAQTVNKVIVLVSPSYYQQRKKFYASATNYKVLPLLFRWNKLNAVQIKTLMQLQDNDAQLYVHVMMAKLRKYQRDEIKPDFGEFFKELQESCFGSQQAPLEQRLEILRQFISDSDENEKLRPLQQDFVDQVQAGTLIIADLTDPMLSPQDANGVFQVLLQQFRQKALPCGKIVAFDEAHKYVDKKDGLTKAMVDSVRLMRHEGLRIVISTQSPLIMPHELLELSSMVVCHQFQSPQWYTQLANVITLPKQGFESVRNLGAGEALVHLRQAKTPTMMLKMRKRITEDRGATRLHTKKAI